VDDKSLLKGCGQCHVTHCHISEMGEVRHFKLVFRLIMVSTDVMQEGLPLKMGMFGMTSTK